MKPIIKCACKTVGGYEMPVYTTVPCVFLCLKNKRYEHGRNKNTDVTRYLGGPVMTKNSVFHTFVVKSEEKKCVTKANCSVKVQKITFLLPNYILDRTDHAVLSDSNARKISLVTYA